LLPSVLYGERDIHHTSVLLWPTVPRPPEAFWTSWRMFLQHFTRGRTLMTSLGPWKSRTHLNWRWFSDSQHIVWEQLGDNSWKRYVALAPNRRQTRHSSKKYQEGDMASSPPTTQLYPATIESHSSEQFTVSISSTRFVDHAPQSPPDLWRHTTPPTALSDTPTFFQHLISTPPTDQECLDTAQEIQEKHLLACSDGACDSSRGISSYGTVFASGLLKQQISSVVGPVDGHPSLVTSYRAELSGIVATLYLVYRICLFYNIREGAMTLYCDNKGALANAFKTIKPGITPYFKTDHDLVELAQALIHLIPILITTSWVKGHYTGKHRQYQHDLNDKADKIAGQ
jgi:ribonuclease HI